MSKFHAVEADLMPRPLAPYSQAIRCGDLFISSGQIGIDPQSQKLQVGLKAQVQQIFSNIKHLLEAENLNLSHIIKSTIFLTDLKNFQEVNEYYQSHFQFPFPARSCVQVSALPAGADIEIEFMATYRDHV